MRLLILSVVLAAFAGAQSHPDFSGTWKQDNSRSTVRPGSIIQYSNKIELRDQKLTVTTILGANGDRKESTYTRGYVIGAKPSTSSDREGEQFTNTVKWDGYSLVFETVQKEKTALTSREVWTLSRREDARQRKFIALAGGVAIPIRRLCWRNSDRGIGTFVGSCGLALITGGGARSK